METGEERPIVLSYGHDNVLRRWVRSAIALAIVGLAGALVYQPVLDQAVEAREYLSSRLQRERTLGQCLRYSAPAKAVIFDERPLRAVAEQFSLVRVPGGGWDLSPPNGQRSPESAALWQSAFESMWIASRQPDCTQFFDLATLYYPRRVRCLPGLRQPRPPLLSGDPPASGFKSMLFLHRRRTPAGKERLACVRFDGPAFALLDAPLVFVEIYATEMWRSSLLVSSSRITSLPLRRGAEPLRLYAGQPDPADQSHFTIQFTRGSARGSIDGWLRDDDSVAFKVHDTTESAKNPRS